MAGGRPPIYDTPEAMEAAIHEYFNPEQEVMMETKIGAIPTGEKKPQPRKNPTVTGLALHLGFESRQSIYDYKEKGEFSYIIKRALLGIENGYEAALYGNNVAGPIFALKNMGWVDKTEVDNNTNLTVNWPEERTYEADSQTDAGDRGAGG